MSDFLEHLCVCIGIVAWWLFVLFLNFHREIAAFFGGAR